MEDSQLRTRQTFRRFPKKASGSCHNAVEVLNLPEAAGQASAVEREAAWRPALATAENPALQGHIFTA